MWSYRGTLHPQTSGTAVCPSRQFPGVSREVNENEELSEGFGPVDGLVFIF